MGKFQASNIRTMRMKIGESVSLDCEVPLGFPPPIVTWQTIKNAQLEYIKQTNRIAVDVNGRFLNLLSKSCYKIHIDIQCQIIVNAI